MSMGPPRGPGPDPAPASAGDASLAMPDRNKLGVTGLVTLGVAYMGLALAAYFNFGIMEGLAGPVVPLAFLAVTAAMLPTAVSYAVMNGHRPSAGSAFTWLWEATVPWLGVWLGWILVITYVVGAMLQPVMFGMFFNSFLSVAGVHAGAFTAICGGAIAVLTAGFLTRRDIRISARTIGVFICIEAGFVALLSVYIDIRQGLNGRLSWQPLMPSHATSWSGVVNAVLFAVLSIAAFDIVAPIAEETKSPRSLVPRATIIVTLVAGAYWAVTSFGIVSSVSSQAMASYVNSGMFTPIYPVAGQYLGSLKIMVPLTGFTASLAALSAVSIAASRQLFALAREHMAPKAFAAAGPDGAVGWNTQLLVLACCAVLPVLITLYQDDSPERAFAWIGQTYVFLILIPYTLTCCANIIYHVRYQATRVRWLTNIVLPAMGIVINGYIFYKNFLVMFVFHPSSFRSQTSITVACLTLVALAAVATAAGSWRLRRSRKPGLPEPRHRTGTAPEDRELECITAVILTRQNYRLVTIVEVNLAEVHEKGALGCRKPLSYFPLCHRGLDGCQCVLELDPCPGLQQRIQGLAVEARQHGALIQAGLRGVEVPRKDHGIAVSRPDPVDHDDAALVWKF